jgi:hypothetical protein
MILLRIAGAIAIGLVVLVALGGMMMEQGCNHGHNQRRCETDRSGTD